MEHQTTNSKGEVFYTCPYCPCTFFTQQDLQTHIETFGTNKWQHQKTYSKTHYFDIQFKKQRKQEPPKPKFKPNKNQQKLT